MPSRKFASRRRSRRQSTVGKITPPLDVRSEDSISSLMKLVKKGPITIILVYADWCGHCHTYKPKFDEAAKNRKSPFQVASINETMINSVNNRIINSMNKSAKPINVSGYPSVISLTKNGDSLKDLSQEAAIKMLNTPMPKNVSMSNDVPNTSMNVPSASMNMPNTSMNVPSASMNMPNTSMNVPSASLKNASMNIQNSVENSQPTVAQPIVKLNQTYVSQPLLRIGGKTGGSYDPPIAPKYLGGCLYKSLSSKPYQLGNPLNLFKSLSKKTRKLKLRK